MSDKPQSREPGRSDDLVLAGGSVVTLDDQGTIYSPGAVVIRDGLVVEVGPAKEISITAGAKKVDTSGQVVMPGFYDCHTHLFQVAGRGLGDGFGLLPWLQDFMIPMSLEMTPAEAISLCRMAALHAVRSGTVGVVDHHYGGGRDVSTTLSIVESIRSVGLRGAVARVMIGSRTKAAELMGIPDGNFVYSTEEEFDLTRAAMTEANGSGIVKVWPGPGNVTFCSAELLSGSRELAEQHGVNWHTHCSEDAAEIELFRDVYGVRPFEWMEAEGILDHRATLAHSIHLDDAEMEIAANSRPHVVNNPISNAFLGAGTMPLTSFEDVGVNVAAGTDGCAVAAQDMFEVVRFGALVQRLLHGDAAAAGVARLLHNGTRSGASMLGLDGGQVAEGAVADLVVLDLNGVGHQPINDVVATIGWFAGGADVKMTIVDGRIVVADGRSVLVDEEEVVASARRAARDVVARIR